MDWQPVENIPEDVIITHKQILEHVYQSLLQIDYSWKIVIENLFLVVYAIMCLAS